MTISFDLLPVELQASIVELRQAHVPEDAIGTLIARTLAALGVKNNKVQIEVWQMEERLGRQLAQIGDKLQADLQTQHGETNQMLIELRHAQQEAHPQIREALVGIAELKKDGSELADWRSRIEVSIASFYESRDQSLEERAELQAAKDDAASERVQLFAAVADLDERLTIVEQVVLGADAKESP